MRVVLTLFLFLCELFLSIEGQSQSNKLSKEDSVDVQKASIDYCSCYRKLTDSLHPALLEMIEISVLKDGNAAKDTLIKRMIDKPDEYEKIGRSIELLSGDALNKVVGSCQKDLDERYPLLDGESDKINENGVRYLEELLSKLSQCKYVYYFMVLGRKSLEKKAKD
jgi:hypothetical protein